MEYVLVFRLQMSSASLQQKVGFFTKVCRKLKTTETWDTTHTSSEFQKFLVLALLVSASFGGFIFLLHFFFFFF